MKFATLTVLGAIAYGSSYEVLCKDVEGGIHDTLEEAEKYAADYCEGTYQLRQELDESESKIVSSETGSSVVLPPIEVSLGSLDVIVVEVRVVGETGVSGESVESQECSLGSDGLNLPTSVIGSVGSQEDTTEGIDIVISITDPVTIELLPAGLTLSCVGGLGTTADGLTLKTYVSAVAVPTNGDDETTEVPAGSGATDNSYDSTGVSSYDSTGVSSYDSTGDNSYDSTGDNSYDSTDDNSYDTTDDNSYGSTEDSSYDTTEDDAEKALQSDGVESLMVAGVLVSSIAAVLASS